jgi:hypothetical protein
MKRTLLVGLVVAALAGPALAGPVPIQSLVSEGWLTITETVDMRVYYRVDPAPTAEGFRRVSVVVDMADRSMRMQREYDCQHARLRNRGATLFRTAGLQGAGQDFTGWDRWMGFLSYVDARNPADYNGLLSDAVCPNTVPSATDPQR